MKSWDDVLKENTVTKTVEEVDIRKMNISFMECTADLRCMYKDIFNVLVEDCKDLDKMMDNITEELTSEDLQKNTYILDLKLCEMEKELLKNLCKLYETRQAYDNIGINRGATINDERLNYIRKKLVEMQNNMQR
jgi:hypothetical protein